MIDAPDTRSHARVARGLAQSALVALSVLTVPRVEAQSPRAPTVAVAGVTWDSLAARPLAGALVQLVRRGDTTGQAHTATSDSLGRWRIDGLTPGEHLAGYFHPVLDALGLQAPTVRALVTEDSVGRLNFSIPGAAGVRRALCGPPPPDDSTGVLVGLLRTAATDAPVPGATLTIGWVETSIGRGGLLTERRRVPVRADDDGRYLACGVPSDTPIEVDGRGPGLATGLLVLAVPPRGIVMRDLRLGDSAAVARAEAATARAADAAASGDTTDAARAVAPSGPASVRGSVVGPDGKPIARAQVRVVGLARSALTTPAGTFAIDGLPEGTFGLEARSIGYTPVFATADLRAGTPATVRLAFGERVQTLASVVVRGKRSASVRLLDELARRRRGSGSSGRLLGPEEIARAQAFLASDLVRLSAGFRTMPTGRGFGQMILGRRGCRPRVLVDGMPVPDTDLDAIVRPELLLAVETYSGMGAPAELAGPQNDCGVVAFWTRR